MAAEEVYCIDECSVNGAAPRGPHCWRLVGLVFADGESPAQVTALCLGCGEHGHVEIDKCFVIGEVALFSEEQRPPPPPPDAEWFKKSV